MLASKNKKRKTANIRSGYYGQRSDAITTLVLTLYRIVDLSDFVKLVFVRSFLSKLDEWAKRLLADRVS